MQKKKYNMAIVGLFVVVLLLFGLLSGLYVVNQSVTVQNRADVLDEPYIECVWDMTEPELEYVATIYEVDIVSGDEKEVLSMGGDGSIIFHDVQPDKLYRCEITAMGGSCGVDTYQFTRNPITLTPVPTARDEAPDKGETGDTTDETESDSVNDSDQNAGDQSGDELTLTVSEDSESTGSDDDSDSDAEGVEDKGGAVTSTPSPTPTESDEDESAVTPSSSTTSTPTKASTTPPVSGLPGLSILLLIAGLAVVAFGLVL